MGCHTWVYEPEIRTIDELRKEWIEKYYYLLNEDKSINKEIWNSGNYALYKWRKRRLKMLKLIIMGKKSHDNLILNELTFTYKGTRYSNASKCIDHLLRIFNYPKVMLESYEDTIKFIEECFNKNNGAIFVNEFLIKEFWINNPSCLITFG